MKIAFKILPPQELNGQLHLLIEQSDDELHFAFYSRSPLKLEGFYALSFPKHLSPSAFTEKVAGLLAQEDIFSQSFRSVRLFLNHRRSFLRNSLPGYADFHDMHAADKRYDRVVSSAGESGTVDAELFKSLSDVLHRKFPGLHVNHSLTCHRQHVNSDRSGKQLLLSVYNNTIRITVSTGNHIDFLQYFEYAVPADVCYYLLSVCRELKMDPANTTVVIAGMVAKSSNLYEEIEKYVGGIEFLMLKAESSISEALEENPDHFYSHFSYLAACE